MSTLKEGNLPLHQAAINGNVEILEFLIKQHKERDGMPELNFTPYPSIIEYINKDSMTPLILAAKYNNLVCAILLVEDGANIFSLDNKM